MRFPTSNKLSPRQKLLLSYLGSDYCKNRIDGENVILNTSPSLGLGYSEVCQYIVFADGKIQPTNPVRSEVILNMPMQKIK